MILNIILSSDDNVSKNEATRSKQSSDDEKEASTCSKQYSDDENEASATVNVAVKTKSISCY